MQKLTTRIASSEKKREKSITLHIIESTELLLFQDFMESTDIKKIKTFSLQCSNYLDCIELCSFSI